MAEYKKNKVTYQSISLFTGTFFIFGPIYMHMTNSQELWFGLGLVMTTAVACGFFVCLLLAALGHLLPSNILPFYTNVILGIGIALYIQSYLLRWQYGPLDGSVNWPQSNVENWINLGGWLGCLAIPFIICKFKQKIYGKFVSITVFSLIGIQILLLTFTAIDSEKLYLTRGPYYLSTKNIFTVSREKNIIVFVLDNFDRSHMDNLLIEDPGLLTNFKDFTYYNKAESAAQATRNAVPHLLTGNLRVNDKPYNEYLKIAYAESPLFKALQENGYKVGLYTRSLFIDKNFIENNLDIFQNVPSGPLPNLTSFSDFTKELYRFTAIRFFPALLKKKLRLSGNNFDDLQEADKRQEPPYYLHHNFDLKFYADLANGLNVDFDAQPGPYFKLYHLFAAHPPVSYDENLETLSQEDFSSDYMAVQLRLLKRQARGSLKIVERYIQKLKESAIYDQTVVIVMADHGYGNPTPILMVKEKNANHPFEVDSTPFSYYDFMPVLLNYISDAPGGFKDWLPKDK